MIKKIRVLYLSHDGMTDALGQSQVITYLKKLSNLGVDFDLISFEKTERFYAKKKQIEEDIRNTSIRWHPLKYNSSIPVFSTQQIINEGWQKAKELYQLRPFDIVHARAQVMGNIAIKAKKKLGAKMIFDMRGWWTDEKFESGNWDHIIFKPLYYYLKRQEAKFFREADYVVSLTEAGKREIVSKYNRSTDIGVIPTCVDFDIFKPFDQEIRNKIREDLCIPKNAFILIYSGSLGGSYSVEHIFKVYERLNLKTKNCYFLILSKDANNLDQEVVSNYINHSDRVRSLSVDFKEVYKYLITADLGLIIYNKEYSVIGRSPTKLGEYWSCGIPAVAINGIGDIDELINRYKGSGAVFCDFTDENIDKALTLILENTVDKKKLRNYSRDYYDLNKGVDFYFSVYNDLMN